MLSTLTYPTPSIEHIVEALASVRRAIAVVKGPWTNSCEAACAALDEWIATPRPDTAGIDAYSLWREGPSILSARALLPHRAKMTEWRGVLYAPLQKTYIDKDWAEWARLGGGFDLTVSVDDLLCAVTGNAGYLYSVTNIPIGMPQFGRNVAAYAAQHAEEAIKHYTAAA